MKKTETREVCEKLGEVMAELQGINALLDLVYCTLQNPDGERPSTEHLADAVFAIQNAVAQTINNVDQAEETLENIAGSDE